MARIDWRVWLAIAPATLSMHPPHGSGEVSGTYTSPQLTTSVNSVHHVLKQSPGLAKTPAPRPFLTQVPR